MMAKRILIVDDSEAVRRAIHAWLNRVEFEVCGEAVDGLDAIEKAQTLKPDLILLDAAMPKTNGIVAASALRALLPNVRIILFSMYTDEVTRTLTPKQLGVDAVIAKTDGILKLTECVQSMLRPQA
jgi:DNA-binding NarL/FixJ family response regulator